MTDEQRDAYLREALRHAPDAQLQPPSGLSAFILNEARAKARDGTPAARPPRGLGAAVWAWLARPSVAAGFAGVMAATLVGLMWWDQPMDPALPRRPEPAAATAPAPVAPAAPPSVVTTPAPVAAAPAVPPAPPAQEAKRRATAQPELKQEQRKPAQDADKKMAESATVATPAAPPVTPAAPAAEATGGLAQPPREEAPAAAKPAPPMPPAPAAAPSAFADQATRSADTLAKAKSSNAEPARSRLATGAAEATNARGAAKAESNELRERQEAEAFATIGRLRAAIAAEPERWAWQRGSGTAQAMNDALYGWLAQLDNATRSPWPTRVARETAPALGRELQLLRGGRVLHTLRLTERGVLWENGQSSRQFELPAATLAELQAALDAAAP